VTIGQKVPAPPPHSPETEWTELPSHGGAGLSPFVRSVFNPALPTASLPLPEAWIGPPDPAGEQRAFARYGKSPNVVAAPNTPHPASDD